MNFPFDGIITKDCELRWQDQHLIRKERNIVIYLWQDRDYGGASWRNAVAILVVAEASRHPRIQHSYSHQSWLTLGLNGKFWQCRPSLVVSAQTFQRSMDYAHRFKFVMKIMYSLSDFLWAIKSHPLTSYKLRRRWWTYRSNIYWFYSVNHVSRIHTNLN